MAKNQRTEEAEAVADVETNNFGVQTITASKGNDKASVEFDFGSDLDELVNALGPEVVHDQARQAITVSIQAWVRARVKKGKSEEQIREEFATAGPDGTSWRPGIRVRGTSRTSTLEKAVEAFEKMSAEERQAYIQRLQDRVAAADAG